MLAKYVITAIAYFIRGGNEKIRNCDVLLCFHFVGYFVWAIAFKLLCPKFFVIATVLAFIAATMMSMILLTKCFIEIDIENERIADSLDNIYD